MSEPLRYRSRSAARNARPERGTGPEGEVEPVAGPVAGPAAPGDDETRSRIHSHSVREMSSDRSSDRPSDRPRDRPAALPFSGLGMSAIAALCRFDGRGGTEDAIGRMTAALAPYGPDGQGIWTDGAVALSHRRMVLLPEDRTDPQPVADKASGLVLAAAARLDNRGELCAALDLPSGVPDSRLILDAFKRWGENSVERMLGAFAFIVWSPRERRLFCARDHLGELPLFIHHGTGFFACASMPGGLLACPEIPRLLDEAAIVRLLALNPPAPTGDGVPTLFSRIFLLPPGHCLTVDAEGRRLRCYWRPDPARRIVLANDDAYAEALRALLDDAVSARLRSIGSVGCQLSGGLDSPVVALTAARLLAAEGRRLTAFTAAPRAGYAPSGEQGWPLDESHHAGLVAGMRANIDHVIVRSDGETLFDGLDRYCLAAGQPPNNPCNQIWLDAIGAQARRRGIRTLLTASRGNLTFSYDGHRRLPGLFASGDWVSLFREIAASPLPLRTVLSMTVEPFVPPSLMAALRRMAGRGREEPALHSALHPDFHDLLARSYVDDRRRNRWGLPIVDARSRRIAGLQIVDAAPIRMAARALWGIDQRDPTFDRRVVEFCLAIPEEQYLKDGVSRRLARRAFGRELPAPLLDRRSRGRQAADWHEGWTRSRAAMAEELDRLAASPMAARVLDLPRLRALVDRWPVDGWPADGWPADGWRSPAVERPYRFALGRGIAVGRFIRRMEGGNE